MSTDEEERAMDHNDAATKKTGSSSPARKAIRKIIPVRASVFERKHIELRKDIDSARQSIDEIAQSATASEEALKQQSETLNSILNVLSDERRAIQSLADAIAEVGKKADDLQATQNVSQKTLSDNTRNLNSILGRIEGLQRETMWADIFRQTIAKPAEWLKDPSLSPGRWAVGFPFLYVLYRTLNEMKPKRILELGLGQTTKMIAQYAAFHPEVEHHVVEHDEEWVNFWLSSNTAPENTHFHILGLAETEHPSASHKVRCYQGFSDEFKGMSFDFISVDAPFGYDMTELARIDILSILPDSLAPSFAIMVDDYNRKGEQSMVREMEKALESAGIEFKRGVYRGEKHATIATSTNNAFLCSM